MAKAMNLLRDGAVIWEVLGSEPVFKLTVRGFSMWPAIRDGDVLEIEVVCNQPLSVGEIVLIRTENQQPLVHRIIQVHEDKVITQGDRTWTADGLVRRDQVAGRVIAAQRGSSRLRFDRKMDRFKGMILAKTLPGVKKIIFIGKRLSTNSREVESDDKK